MVMIQKEITNKSKKPNLKRLEKIIQHVKSGNKLHEKFDFAFINALEEGRNIETLKGCGTNGCMMGDFPFIFPRYFKFSTTNSSILSRLNVKFDFDNAFDTQYKEFLNLTQEELTLLFYPYEQNFDDTKLFAKIGRYKIVQLGEKATRKQVLNNIEKFVKGKKSILQ